MSAVCQALFQARGVYHRTKQAKMLALSGFMFAWALIRIPEGYLDTCSSLLEPSSIFKFFLLKS